MSPEAVAALVTAGGSLLVALLSLLTSRTAVLYAKRAEEAAKQAEQLRVKGTDAGDRLLTAFAEILILAESVGFLLDRRAEKALTGQETEQYFVPLGQSAASMRKLLYANAIYLSPEIAKGVEDVLRALESRTDFSAWGSVVTQLKNHHSQLASLFRRTYLLHGSEGPM